MRDLLIFCFWLCNYLLIIRNRMKRLLWYNLVESRDVLAQLLYFCAQRENNRLKMLKLHLPILANYLLNVDVGLIDLERSRWADFADVQTCRRFNFNHISCCNDRLAARSNDGRVFFTVFATCPPELANSAEEYRGRVKDEIKNLSFERLTVNIRSRNAVIRYALWRTFANFNVRTAVPYEYSPHVSRTTYFILTHVARLQRGRQRQSFNTNGVQELFYPQKCNMIKYNIQWYEYTNVS